MLLVSHPDNVIDSKSSLPAGSVMAIQLLVYNNPEGIIDWIDQPSQAHSQYDYCILAMQSLGDTPRNFGSATRSPFRELWIDPIIDELRGHFARPTFELALRAYTTFQT